MNARGVGVKRSFFSTTWRERARQGSAGALGHSWGSLEAVGCAWGPTIHSKRRLLGATLRWSQAVVVVVVASRGEVSRKTVKARPGSLCGRLSVVWDRIAHRKTGEVVGFIEFARGGRGVKNGRRRLHSREERCRKKQENRGLGRCAVV